MRALEEESIAGLGVSRATFRPDATVHAGKTCEGARFVVTDRARFSPASAALGIARALRKVAPEAWKAEGFVRMLGHRDATRAFEAGEPASAIRATWERGLERFRAKRDAVLLYH